VDETAGEGLRLWARGGYDLEAGVELLIRAFDGRFARQGCPGSAAGTAASGWTCRSWYPTSAPCRAGSGES
jgi:hypothetical protein